MLKSARTESQCVGETGNWRGVKNEAGKPGLCLKSVIVRHVDLGMTAHYASQLCLSEPYELGRLLNLSVFQFHL